MTAQAPLYDDIAGGPEGGVAHWVWTSDDIRIRLAHWPVPNAKGTVLIFPGRTEFIEKYGRVARDFAARGFASVTIDWRGQGLADRLHPEQGMGHVSDYRHYQRDVAAMLSYVAEQGLPQPLYILAHSMGGPIALRALIDGLEVKACGFSAPMWGIKGSSPLLAYAWSVSTLAHFMGQTNRIVPGQHAGTYVLRQAFEGNTLTGDEASWDMLVDMAKKRPELTLGGPSIAWLRSALHEMRRLHALPSPDVPCLTYLGTEEDIVSPSRIKERMARWPNGKLHILQGGRHEMLMDKPEFRDTMLDGYTALFEANT